MFIHDSHLTFLILQNLKRQQLDEERYSSIERANYLLLERMSHIMTHPQTVDMKQSLPPPKSLNKDGRKKELMRITEENHNILRRIQVETFASLFPFSSPTPPPSWPNFCLLSTKSPTTLSKNGQKRRGVRKRTCAISASFLPSSTFLVSGQLPAFLLECTAKTAR
jgi:hypothetical protein